MTSSSNDTDREALIETIAHGFPGWVEKIREHPAEAKYDIAVNDAARAMAVKFADRILAEFLPGHDERVKGEAAGRVWREGYYTGKRDYAGSITGGMPISTPNPYEGES